MKKTKDIISLRECPEILVMRNEVGGDSIKSRGETMKNLVFVAPYTVYNKRTNELFAVRGGKFEDRGWDPQIGSTETWKIGATLIKIPNVSYEDASTNPEHLIEDALASKMEADVKVDLDIMLQDHDRGGSWYDQYAI